MEPVTVTTTIARPREEIFAYLSDVANHPEFSDHYLVDWRLTREDSFGKGAGARFEYKSPLNRYNHADFTLVELQPPWRLVFNGRGGKFNRMRLIAVYELQPSHGGTEVAYSFELKPATFADSVFQTVTGFSGWFRRKSKKALRRMRSILEDDEQRGQRATIAGR